MWVEHAAIVANTIDKEGFTLNVNEPGSIVGTVVKWIVKRYTVVNSSLKINCDSDIPLDISFADCCKVIYERRDVCLAQIKRDEGIWQSPEFIDHFSKLMEDGYRYMQIYFREVSEKCEGDVRKMAIEMTTYPQCRSVPSQDYLHTFFLFSRLYHYARGCATQLDRDQWAEIYCIDPHEPMPLTAKETLTDQDQEPYFNSTKPQYRWRELYNAFCDLVDQNGLRSQLKKRGDMRFIRWSTPDLGKVDHYGSPDTLPS
jgi:hypothetical protein